MIVLKVKNWKINSDWFKKLKELIKLKIISY